MNISNLSMEQPDNIEVTEIRNRVQERKLAQKKGTDVFECMLMSKFIEFMQFTKRQISIYRV